MRNKILTLVLSIAVITSFVIVGCAREAAPPEEGAPPEEKQYLMKFGCDHMPGYPTHIAMKEMKRIIEDQTDGNVRVEIYMAQTLGSSREMVEGLQLGSLEACAIALPTYVGFDANLGIMDLPFLFSSPERGYEITAGEMGEELLAGLPAKGIIGAAWWSNGFKHFCQNFPVKEPDDFIGKTIRISPNPLLAAQFEAMGANAVTVDYYELYAALQEGVVEGQEQNLMSMVAMKFYEVTDFISLSHHGWISYIVSFGRDWFEQLPQKYQGILLESARAVALSEFANVDAREEGWIMEMRNYGVEISEPFTEDQKRPFKEVMRPALYKELKRMVDEDALERLEILKEEGAKEATIRF